MRERPILFSAPMVRALLNTRMGKFPPEPIDLKQTCKGMTRRIPDSKNAKWKVGDRLWVKETWIPVRWGSYEAIPRDEKLVSWDKPYIQYAADEIHGYHKVWDSYEGMWRPSIFMFRWATRILLEITARREEPLQAITEQDSILEGVFPDADCIANHCARPYRDRFLDLWNELNGARGYGWEKNPTVSVFSFKRVEVTQ